MKKNYLDNIYICDIVYQYMKYKKKENELCDVIKSIVRHLQLMPKYSGYGKSIHDDMLQVSYFNFFNNIHDTKFSNSKIGKVIKVKQEAFFKKYNEIINQDVIGKKMFVIGLSDDKKCLICQAIVKIYDNLSDETLVEAKEFVKENSECYKIRKTKVRLNAYEFKEYYLVVNNNMEYSIEYNHLDFNFFSFITETIKSSFNQVLNREKEYKHSNQVMLWEKSNAYKFDINNDKIKQDIVETIRKVNENFQIKRSKK